MTAAIGLTLLLLAGGDTVARVSAPVPYAEAEKAALASAGEAASYPRPAGVRLRILEPVKRTEHAWILEAVLENQGEAAAEVVVLSLPLHVELGGEGVTRVPHEGPPPPPPVPPRPERLTIPAGGSILFAHGLTRAYYRLAGDAKPVLRWSFHFWDEPRPSGEVALDPRP
ncbi:MAG: hypothetical protein P1V51_11335 [Deltaproteobacteria bacterium]|nr:hypothetical protein [Deltaproteobacteria bacterium]